jgi:hypothetical protein
MTTDVVELFRLGILRLKAKYRPTIEEMAKAAGVSSRHIQGFLSDKERKGLGRRAQHDLAAFFGLSVHDIIQEAKPPLSKEGAISIGNFLREGELAILERRSEISHHPTTIPHHPSGPDPPLPPDQEDDDKLPTAPQAIEMTREVLASRTIYRGALLQNIKAFHKAVQGEQEMSSLRDDMQDMKQQMAAMQAMMARIERNTAAALPVETPTQKRDVQGG